MIAWGVGFLNLFTDMPRLAYDLKAGESEVPAELQHAFDRARAARTVVKESIKAGVTAQEAEDAIYAALVAAGFVRFD